MCHLLDALLPDSRPVVNGRFFKKRAARCPCPLTREGECTECYTPACAHRSMAHAFEKRTRHSPSRHASTQFVHQTQLQPRSEMLAVWLQQCEDLQTSYQTSYRTGITPASTRNLKPSVPLGTAKFTGSFDYL